MLGCPAQVGPSSIALDRLPGARVLCVLGVRVSLLCKSLVIMETQAVSLSLALATGLGQGRDTVVEGAGGRGELVPAGCWGSGECPGR